MFIASKLIDYYRDENEGMLSKRHAYLVSGEVISKIAQDVNLGQIMIFSKKMKKKIREERIREI